MSFLINYCFPCPRVSFKFSWYSLFYPMWLTTPRFPSHSGMKGLLRSKFYFWVSAFVLILTGSVPPLLWTLFLEGLSHTCHRFYLTRTSPCTFFGSTPTLSVTSTSLPEEPGGSWTLKSNGDSTRNCHYVFHPSGNEYVCSSYPHFVLFTPKSPVFTNGVSLLETSVPPSRN